MMKKRKSVIRLCRIVLAIASILLMSLLFVNGANRGMLAFMAKVQFIPALLAGNFIVIALLLLITFLFGRIYCSVICPLGITQDLFNWITKKTGGKKKAVRFGYSRPKSVLRYVILAIYVVAVILGVGSFMALLDPYAAFGRIMSHIFNPAAIFINNLIASSTDIFLTEKYIGLNAVALSVAIVTFVAVAFLAIRGGRTYCNTICPVGTLLGLVSHRPVFRIRIDESKCNRCGLCGLKCRASCIDTKNHVIDYSRCVDCFDCIDNCSGQAIYYSAAEKKTVMSDNSEVENESRRKFLSILALTGVAGSKLWAKDKVNEVQNFVEGRTEQKTVAVSPFGSVSHKHLNSHCTACHLCIDKCPNKVLRPAIREYGLEGVMQPVMDYTKSYCEYDCTLCGEVCPAGAIEKLTPDRKQSIHIGLAVVDKDVCLMSHGSLLCGACRNSCPSGAITLKPDYNQPLTESEIAELDNLPESVARPRVHYKVFPIVDEDLCIGCGLCQFRCPTKAITVNGYEVHK